MIHPSQPRRSTLRFRTLRAGLLSLALMAAGTGQVWATCAPQAPGPSSEATLQESFDDLFGDVGDLPRVLDATACLAEGTDAHWRTNGTTSATILFEIAGYDDSNRFGIYDPLTMSSVMVDLQVFNGGNDAGDTRYIEFISNGAGGWTVQAQRRNASGTVVQSVTDQATFASQVFGFYLFVPTNDGVDPTGDTTPNDRTYYSDTGLNHDATDHLFAYQGNGATFDSDAPQRVRNTVFTAGDYILAWEDLAAEASGYDGDYQDFVVLVRQVTPVPLPAAIWMFAPALLGLATLRRRVSA